MLTLIKGGKIYSPDYLGKKDILICDSKIGYIDEKIDFNSENIEIDLIDAKGKLVFPGFIDSHVHILGGGGEGSYKTRTPEIMLSDIVSAGVTTVVGCLGTDGVTRDMKALIAKARGLEEEGVSTYIYTGSYRIPVRTLMDNVMDDIILIDKIIGVGEIALSDHRGSHATFEEFVKVVSDARVGGMLSGKAGIVNVHMGDGKSELEYLERLIDETEIPLSQVVPTHINRNSSLLKKGIEYGKKGGFVDFTTSTIERFLEDGEVKCSKGLKAMIDEGVDIRNITFTSDGQGSLPVFNEKNEFVGLKIGKCKSLYKEVRDAVIYENIDIKDALRVITSNPAQNLKLTSKGEIKAGKDADLVLVNEEDLKIDTVIAMGKTMVLNGENIVKGVFE